MAAVQEEIVSALEGFSGQLLGPGDDGYDEARRVHNALVDKRPALIARCLGTADVLAAVAVARERGLEISVRGGGHNVGGRAVTERGVMIDLSLMKGIHVDPAARTVRAQGGVTWAELNRETQVHGLAVTGGTVSMTGIAGLTLGGGLGWIMGRYGLAADNLLSAELVTADGRVLTVSETENDDVFWALRGGGGNFGVVISFEYRLHPVGPTVTGGIVVHPFEAAGDLFRFVREFAADLPDDLTLFPAVLHSPDGSGAKLSAVVVGHIGLEDEARRDLEPLLAFGAPLDIQVGPMPYTVLNSLVDASFPAGAFYYWKASFLSDPTDAAIDTIVERFATCPSPMSLIFLEPFHGEVTRIPADATAVPHRERSWNCVVASGWAEPADSERNIRWTRETYAALAPFLDDRRWVNYMPEDDSSDAAARAAYGPNYDRLVEVKTKYDPENLFHLNLNVRPRT
jgi:FAD/FMN-containing dehydrogenase